MPLARISLKKGKPAAYRKAIADNIYEALRETFAVPENDRFVTISEFDGDNFVYSPDYLGIPRSDDLVIMEITVSNTRSVEQKQTLYRRIVERLAEQPGLRPEDVLIILVEVLPAHWSFGLGVASYVK